MSFGGVPLPGLQYGLRCSLQAEGFSTVELRCGLFGSDLELLDANECPEKLGCSRSAVLWATADGGNDLATIELQLDELPAALEHLVLATVGKTGIQGGFLSLMVAAGGFHQQYRRSQSPEHGRGSYVQGCMLAVLSRRGQGWLLQEVVPNIGLSCEQQEDAIVRELYWPEVGVAIERTVTTEAGPSITWLEVFRAYPEGTYPSDDDTETASHESPMGSRPELVTSILSPASELEKASRGCWTEYPSSHPKQTPSSPSSLSKNGRQDFLPFEELRDFGPPRAACKSLLGTEGQMAELCQETGRLSVSLKLSEDRLSKSESLVVNLRSEVAKLQEDKQRFSEEAALKETKLQRLRSELDHCMSELQQRTGAMRAQHAELEQMAKSRAKELAQQERCKGEVAALEQELVRVNQQLVRERSTWEQDKESLQKSLQECTAEAKAARIAQGASDGDLERLRQELFLERAEAARYRTEALEQQKVKEEPTTSGSRVSFQDVAGSKRLEVEMLQAELAKLQTTFAEELGSARARLAVAERRNKDLLENLQSTVRAAHSAKVVERPASLPEPPMVLPKSGDWTGQPETLEQRGQKFQKPQVGSLESTRSHISLGGARSQRQAELWELHSQHRDRSERLARHQEESQWQQLRASCSRSASSETGRIEIDGARVSPQSRSRDFGRLPSAPSSSSSLGETLRRAVAERRRGREHKATRALDEEYTRFVKEGSVRYPQCTHTTHSHGTHTGRDMTGRELREVREGRQSSAPEPFVLSDLGTAGDL